MPAGFIFRCWRPRPQTADSPCRNSATRSKNCAGSACNQTGRKIPPNTQKSACRSASFTEALADLSLTETSSKFSSPNFTNPVTSCLKRAPGHLVQPPVEGVSQFASSHLRFVDQKHPTKKSLCGTEHFRENGGSATMSRLRRR